MERIAKKEVVRTIHEVWAVDIIEHIVFHEFIKHLTKAVPSYNTVQTGSIHRYINEIHPLRAIHTRGTYQLITGYRNYLALTQSNAPAIKVQIEIVDPQLNPKQISILQATDEIAMRLHNASNIDLMCFFAALHFPAVAKELKKIIGDTSDSNIARISNINRDTSRKYRQFIENRIEELRDKNELK